MGTGKAAHLAAWMNHQSDGGGQWLDGEAEGRKRHTGCREMDRGMAG
jgi:hypothetical protein